MCVTLTEPGAYAPDRSPGSVTSPDELPAYAELHEQRRVLFAFRSASPAREQTAAPSSPS
jgi:hypothetical protein